MRAYGGQVGAMREGFEARWHEETEKVISGMQEWRLQHPEATFREIEQALDEQLGKMRARFSTRIVVA